MLDRAFAQNPMHAQLDGWRSQIDACLTQTLDVIAAGSPLLPAMRDALLGPGKRLRPLLTLASCAACGGAAEQAVIRVACATELLHAASLVYDDLPCMDDSADRRGAPALHVAHGQATALLAAISLTNGAYLLTDGLPADVAIAITRLLATTAGAQGLAAGQYYDLNPGAAGTDSVRRLKTGVLFSAAATIGCLCALAGPQTTAAREIAAFADALGMAFQLLDDLDDHDAAEGNARLATALAAQVTAARHAIKDNAEAGPLHAYLDLVFGA